MADWHIVPATLQSRVRIPSSKSQTLRAILFAALSSGLSRIEEPLPSPDTEAMIRAAELFGASVWQEGNALVVRGTCGRLSQQGGVLDCGGSGIVLRFAGALAGLASAPITLLAQGAIRPVEPLISGLRQLGAKAEGNPLSVQGPITKTSASVDGQDSQPVSGLLIASAFAPHAIELFVDHPGETPWVDLTLHWFDKLGIAYSHHNHTHYQLTGGARISAFHYKTSGDFSSAAFALAAALLTNSEMTLENLDFLDPQGDKKLFFLLQQMGARLSIQSNCVQVHGKAELRGMKIDVNECIDALPILAVLGCFAKSPTELYNGRIARKKESDRIFCIAQELRKMGAKIEEREDGLLIHPSNLHGADVESHGDHRIALSLAVAALAAGPTRVRGVECVAKTYPTFLQDCLG